jgi:hypothetical protein
MGRRSNAAKSVENAIKEQPTRRPRKKREPRVVPFGLQAGQLVIVSATREFKGKKFGIVSEACKYDGGVMVRLSDDGSIARYVCVRPELGDTIERLNSNNGTHQANKSV